jgi:membrane-associated phospholipid phosphatase
MLSVLCLVLLMALTPFVWLKLTDEAEMVLVNWIIDGRSDAVTTVLQGLTFITSATPAMLLSLGACVADWRMTSTERRTMTTLVTRHSSFAIAFFGALACNIGLRILIGRLRPEVAYIPNALPEITAVFQRYAFPSGHAGSATVACFSWVAVLWRFRRARWIVLAVALFVWLGAGFGRFYMGLHWPTDVLGGYLLAGAWVCGAIGYRLRVAGLTCNPQLVT